PGGGCIPGRAGGTGVNSTRVGSTGVSGTGVRGIDRRHTKDLLSRLTGRVLKDDLSRTPYQPAQRGPGPRAGLDGISCRVAWVTMSDSCHTDVERASEPAG